MHSLASRRPMGDHSNPVLRLGGVVSGLVRVANLDNSRVCGGARVRAGRAGESSGVSVSV